MNKDKALRLALEALEQWNTPLYKRGTVIKAIKEALETKDEPVYWEMPDGKIVDKWALQFYRGDTGTPLYTTPQPKQEQGEPVAWATDDMAYRPNGLPLYTTPQLQTKDEPKCVAIVEVFGKDWRLDYMSLPVGKHNLYAQQYTYTTTPQPETKDELLSMRMPKVGDRVVCIEDESLGVVHYLTAGGSPEIRFDDGSHGTYLLREFAELFGYADTTPQSETKDEPKLIGWRTADFLNETTDIKSARNWEVHYEVLPIFEGDPNTKLVITPQPKQEQDEPVAMRYDFDGYGYKYIDNGSGSDWRTRIKDAEPLYTTPNVSTFFLKMSFIKGSLYAIITPTLNFSHS